MTEIKVRIYAHENHNFKELYKVICGEVKTEYFVRYTSFCGGEWYFVADPLGYCELSHSCPDDYVFIVCDNKGNELLKDSNGEIRHPFPTLENKAIMVWNEIIENYPTIDGLNNWLKSFITKDVKENKLKGEPCIYDNWVHFWYDEIKSEVIKKFEHLGENYCIYKVTMKHRYCDCEWVEYKAGSEEMDEYESYIKHFGSWFDTTVVGECYGNYEAVELVETELKNIYPSKFNISRIESASYGIDYERKMNFRKAAEMLINGNYERKFVDAIIETERQNKSFYASSEEIKKDYPNYKPDYNIF